LGRKWPGSWRYNKANLIIAARRADKLEQLKAELETSAGVQVKVIIADLSLIEDADSVIAESIADNNLYGAILNAGVTYFGRHAHLPWDILNSMLQTNVIGVVRMTNSLVNYFEKPGKEGGHYAGIKHGWGTSLCHTRQRTRQQRRLLPPLAAPCIMNLKTLTFL
jgi:short-subunit dehydrogenase